MGILAKLFGKKKTISFKGITKNGERFSGEIELKKIGATKLQIERNMKTFISMETGKEVKKITITSFL